MDPFLGEIRLFAGNFAPNNWLFCQGQLLPIQRYTTLFSLLGTNYGGNGTSTFGLPDLRGRTPIHWGQGPGLSDHFIGEQGGTATVALTLDELPAHTHAAQAVGTPSEASPEGALWSWPAGRGAPTFYGAGAPNAPMLPTLISPTGGSQTHNNYSPFLVLNYIIAMQGIFPQRP